MGDVGDVYKAIKEDQKERKEKRLKAFDSEGWIRVTEYHYYKMVAGHRLDYWPSTCRFRYKNKTHFKNVEGFIKNIEKTS